MSRITKEQVESRLVWHRKRVEDLDKQLDGMRHRSLSAIKRRLTANRVEHRKTIKLLERIEC